MSNTHHNQSEYPEFENQGIILAITTVAALFKFVGLILLSFHPESKSSSNATTIFSNGFLRTLFQRSPSYQMVFDLSAVDVSFLNKHDNELKKLVYRYDTKHLYSESGRE